MTRSEYAQNVTVNQLLTGATQAIATSPCCGLPIAAASGFPGVGPMGRLQAELEEDDWRIRLVADAHSPKVRDIRRNGQQRRSFKTTTRPRWSATQTAPGG